MNCRLCNSKKTRVTTTELREQETWRYCRCLACDHRFKTVEQYAPIDPQAAANALRRGVDNPRGVFTNENVCDIRKLAAAGTNQQAIADEYGVSYSCIRNIVKGRSYRNVA